MFWDAVIGMEGVKLGENYSPLSARTLDPGNYPQGSLE